MAVIFTDNNFSVVVTIKQRKRANFQCQDPKLYYIYKYYILYFLYYIVCMWFLCTLKILREKKNLLNILNNKLTYIFVQKKNDFNYICNIFVLFFPITYGNYWK